MVPTEQEDGDMPLTGEHMRAARALLNWSQAKLARASGVSLPTIKRLEVMSGTISANTMTVEAIRKAIVDAGVDLIEEDVGGGAGARLRQRRQP
jgi:predicted transcriptional regulator